MSPFLFQLQESNGGKRAAKFGADERGALPRGAKGWGSPGQCEFSTLLKIGFVMGGGELGTFATKIMAASFSLSFSLD